MRHRVSSFLLLAVIFMIAAPFATFPLRARAAAFDQSAVSDRSTTPAGNGKDRSGGNGNGNAPTPAPTPAPVVPAPASPVATVTPPPPATADAPPVVPEPATATSTSVDTAPGKSGDGHGNAHPPAAVPDGAASTSAHDHGKHGPPAAPVVGAAPALPIPATLPAVVQTTLRAIGHGGVPAVAAVARDDTPLTFLESAPPPGTTFAGGAGNPSFAPTATATPTFSSTESETGSEGPEATTSEFLRVRAARAAMTSTFLGAPGAFAAPILTTHVGFTDAATSASGPSVHTAAPAGGFLRAALLSGPTASIAPARSANAAATAERPSDGAPVAPQWVPIVTSGFLGIGLHEPVAPGRPAADAGRPSR